MQRKLLEIINVDFNNRSTADHILCIRQILEKKWEYNEAVHRLFIDCKKAYDSVRREVLHILITVTLSCILILRHDHVLSFICIYF